MSNATIEFPIDKACEKLPRIVVGMNANAMIEWINQHKELEREYQEHCPQADPHTSAVSAQSRTIQPSE